VISAPLATSVTPLAEARGLEVTLRRRGRSVRALDGVDLEWRHNEVLGVVGESGCGKTTLARTLLGLEQPSGGELRFEGAALDRGGARSLRRRVQLVFQDPYQSLNPRMRVSDLVQEPLRMQGMGRAERVLRAAAALEDAGLAPAERFWHRYPHELSGGQRQRVAIASALAPEPAGLVCDEPVSALDVSVRAQVLHLLLGLRRARGLALLLITHDIGLAWALCDRVAVMYVGRVIEIGNAADVLERPQHPYTQALIAVAPSTRRRLAGRAAILEGEVPDASRLPSGCRFHPRCSRARERCSVEDVALRPGGAPGQTAACWYPGVEPVSGLVDERRAADEGPERRRGALVPDRRPDEPDIGSGL
jgi:oligopeptide/dipeptide ABC transporter ATP-binding protein